MKNILRPLGFLLAVMVTASPLFAHGGGSVRLASGQVAAGGSVKMTGEKLGKGERFRIELRGVLNNYPAGSVQSTDAGVVTADVAVPATVRPGSYTLVLLAADGDVAARTEVSINVPAPAGAPNAPAHDMGAMGMAEMSAMTATADMMDVDVNTTPLEWTVIGVVLLGSIAGGAFLLLRSRTDA